MKKLLSFFLVATIFLGFFTGCKKGDMDPFFSIYSRKHRVVGEWEINSWKDTRAYVNNSGETTTIKIVISGTSITIDSVLPRVNEKDTTKVWTGTVNESKYHFKKTGELDYVLDFTLSHHWKNTDENTGHTYDSTYTWNYRFINTGTWNFLAKIDEYKSKERISMVWENTKEVVNFTSQVEDDDGNGGPPVITNAQTLESTENNYANGEFNDIWALKELKEKEIIMNKVYNQIYTHALTGIQGEKETMSGTSETTLQPKAKE